MTCPRATTAKTPAAVRASRPGTPWRRSRIESRQRCRPHALRESRRLSPPAVASGAPTDRIRSSGKRSRAGAPALLSRATMRAAAGEAPVADDIRLDRRDLDFVIFADQFHFGLRRDGPATLRAAGWPMVAEFVGVAGQPAVARLMPGFRPARTGVLALGLLIRGRRLGRRARRFVRTLKLTPAQSTRPCSAAANQCDPRAHGVRDWSPWRESRGNQRPRPKWSPKNGGG